MRFIVTCYLNNGELFLFNVYGSSIYQASHTLEQMLQRASPLHDTIKLSDGRTLKIGSILAYEIEEVKPLF